MTGFLNVPIIGLMGYAQAGKDTVGTLLTTGWGYQRVAFADTLRDMLYALDPVVVWYSIEDEHGIDEPGRRVRDIVDCIGWEKAKVVYPEIRSLLQRLGTEAGREILGDNIWVDTAMSKVSGPTVITDVRFPNEYRAVHAQGGHLWRIVRPGKTAVNAHASETSLDGYEADATILNDGSYDDLALKVAGIMEGS